MKKLNKSAIGIFDSGLGGLTVMSAITKLMPHENIIYFGDTAHVPYGSKSKKAVTDYSVNISEFLVKHKVKLIVIACNTASAFALETLKKRIKIPVIGVIDSGAVAAVSNTKNKKICVTGTEGTIKSSAYLKSIKRINKNIKVFQQACPLFVPLAEEGWTDNEIAVSVIKKYLNGILTKKIDTVVLGCTHYPLLKNSIRKVLGKDIKIIDSATAVANQVYDILNTKKMLNNSGKAEYSFYVSDCPDKFKKLGSRFFRKRIKNVKQTEIKSEL